MKRLINFLGWTGISLIVLVLSVALGAFWFGLWMNKGWPGATGLLARLLHADGEYADLVPSFCGSHVGVWS
jgi:predicted small integral membrane protein